MRIEARLAQLGLGLPAALRVPPNVRLPFAAVRVYGDRAYVAGHGPQAADGSVASPLGKVGSDLSVDEAYAAARLTGRSILGSLQRGRGDLARVAAWLKVLGMGTCAPGFNQQPAVINGFSDLILEV